MKRSWKRILAAVLAMSIVFGNVMPASATEMEPVVEVVEAETEVAEAVEDTETPEEPVPENVEETLEEVLVNEDGTELMEALTEEATEKETEAVMFVEPVAAEVVAAEVDSADVTQEIYKGQVEDWDGPALVIRYEHFEEYGLEFTPETIKAALDARSDESFQIVEINYPEVTGSIPAEIWNAAVALLDPVDENDEEDFAHVRFNFYNENGTDQNWNFDSPVAVNPESVTEIDTGITLTFVKEDDEDIEKVTGINVTFDNTSYPVERGAYINFWTDSDRANYDSDPDWQNFINYFGTPNCKVALCDENGQTNINGEYKYQNREPIVIELNGLDVNALPEEGAGVTYCLEKYEYKGIVDELEDGCRALYINHAEAGKEDSLTEKELLAILDHHKGQEYKEIRIEQRRGEENVIYAAVVNTMNSLLDSYADEEGVERKGDMVFYFADEEGFFGYILGDPEDVALTNDTDKCVNAELGTDGAYTVTASVRDAGAEKPYDKLGDAFNAKLYEYAFVHLNRETEEGQAFEAFLMDGSNNGENNLRLKEAPSIRIENGLSENRAYAYVRLRYMDELESDKTYTLEYTDYMGTVEEWEDGYRVLVIDHASFPANKEFTDAAVIEMLQHWSDLEEYFDRIVINYPSITNKCSKGVWNAAVEVYNGNIEGGVRLNFSGSNAMDENWYFEEPESVGKDLNLTAALALKDAGEYGTVKVTSTSLPAKNIVLSFYSDSKRTDFEKFKAAFGEEERALDLKTSTGANIAADAIYYVGEENGCEYVQVSFWDVSVLKSGTNYTFAEDTSYIGNVYYEEGNRWLSLYAWEAENYGLDLKDDAAVVALLKQWETSKERFDVVEIYYAEQPETVNKDVWNALRSLLNEDGTEQIRIAFPHAIEIADGESLDALQEHWDFYDAAAATANFALNVNFKRAEDGCLFAVDESIIPSGSAWMSWHADGPVDEPADKDSEEYTQYQTRNNLQEIFPYNQRMAMYQYDDNLKDYQLVENTEFGSGYNNYEEYTDSESIDRCNVWTDGINISALEMGTEYRIMPSEYRGNIAYHEDEEGNARYELWLDYNDLNCYGYDITNIEGKELYKLVENVFLGAVKSREGMEFYKIKFCCPSGMSEIPAELWNQMTEILIENGTESQIEIDVEGSVVYHTWRFWRPEKITNPEENAIDITSGVAVSEDVVKLKYAQTHYPSESVGITYYSYTGWVTEDDPNLFAALDGKTGLSVIDAVSKEIQPASAHLWKEAWEDGNLELWLSIDDVNRLADDTDYEIRSYVGHVDEWDDGQGRTLNIHYGVAGREEPFGKDELSEILNFHKENNLTYDGINIEQAETDVNSIYAEIASLAADIMKTDDEGRKGRLTFSFWDKYGRFEWNMDNPGKTPVVSDFGVDVRRSINADKDQKAFMIAAYQKDGTPYQDISDVMKADNILMNIVTQNYYAENDERYDYPEGQYLFDFVAENEEAEHPLELEGEPYVPVYGWVYEDESFVEINQLQNLQLGREYALSNAPYRGDADEEGKHLYLGSMNMGKAQFKEADIEAIVQYYEGKGFDHFAQIVVEQNSAAKNVIDRDIINRLNDILANDSEEETAILFYYYSETKEDTFIRLTEPGDMEKDINATFTYSMKANQGITVKLSTNDYSAIGNVTYGICKQESTAAGQKLKESLAAAFGNADKMEEVQLAVLKAGTEVVDDVYSACIWYPSDDTGEKIYEFGISEAQKLSGGVNYQFHPQTILDDDEIDYQFKVGDEVVLLKQSWMSETAKAETSTKHIFKSLTEYTASIDSTGALNILNEGQVCFTVSYVNNGQSYLEVYKGYAVLELQGIRMNITDTAIEVPAGERKEIELTLKAVPYQYGIDRSAIEWTIKAENESTGEFDNETKVIQALTWDEEEKEILGDGTDGWFAVNSVEEDAKVQITANYEGKEASCIITVRKPLEAPKFDKEFLKTFYAVTNFDTVLNDVELPNEQWAWKEGETKLAPFAAMDSHSFKATYTDGERSVDVDIEVPLITITGVDVIGVEPVWDDEVNLNLVEVPASIEGGETIGMNVMVNMKGITCYCEEEGCTGVHKQNIFNEYFNPAGERLTMKWTAPKNCNVKYDNDTDENGTPMWQIYASDCCVFTADASKAGNKTFTVSLVDTENKDKVLFKDSVMIKVTKNPVANIDFIESISKFDQEEGSGIITVRQVEGSEFAATVTSSDTKVARLKLVSKNKVAYDDGLECNVVETVYEYTELKPGFVDFTVKFKDEIDSCYVISHEVYDYDPKIMETTFELNKAFVGDKTPVTIQFPEEFMAICDATFDISIDESYLESFGLNNDDIRYDIVEGQDGVKYISKVYAELTVSDDAKVKTHKNVPINITFRNDRRDKAETFTAKINVKVINKAPAITFKQTKNVNVFYNDERGYGLLTVDTKGLGYELHIQDDHGFNLNETEEENVFEICAQAGTLKGNKKITFDYVIANDVEATYTASKALTIKVEEKAPSIVLSQKNDTIYPVTGAGESKLQLKDKETGESIYIVGAALDQGKKKDPIPFINWTDETDETEYYGLESVKASKNSFEIAAFGDELIFSMLDAENAVNSTEKYTLQITDYGWNKPVNITYSIKVNTAKPKLKLGTTKLTLNKNKDIAGYQTDVTTLGINGYAGESIWSENVRITGTNTAANQVLNKAISLEYRDGEGLMAKLHPEYDLSSVKGTYKFKVWVTCGNYEANTTLSVAITDKPAVGCLKLSKKGSIDVLARDTSYLTYTVKAGNISGIIEEVYLEGEDANRFYAVLAETENQFYIYAHEGYDLSTKATYKVTPVIRLQNHDYETYEVMATEQAIKVTQGKPKVTITGPDGNVLYTQHGNTLKLNISAILKSKDIEIENVELANYMDVLDISYENGEIILSVLKEDSYGTTFKYGKSYSLKFNVTYYEKAANEKAATATYKVTIK